VELYAEDPGVMVQVVVRRQDPGPQPQCYRAEKKIRIGTLDTLRSTPVEASGGFLVVVAFERNVRKRAEAVAQRFELF
jgi:hypothetical protein